MGWGWGENRGSSCGCWCVLQQVVPKSSCVAASCAARFVGLLREVALLVRVFGCCCHTQHGCLAGMLPGMFECGNSCAACGPNAVCLCWAWWFLNFLALCTLSHGVCWGLNSFAVVGVDWLCSEGSVRQTTVVQQAISAGGPPRAATHKAAVTCHCSLCHFVSMY